jgi:hypothetical protein
VTVGQFLNIAVYFFNNINRNNRMPKATIRSISIECQKYRNVSEVNSQILIAALPTTKIPYSTSKTTPLMTIG